MNGPYEAIGDYPTCARTYATLRIYHPSLDPDSITRGLEIEPTEVRRAGEARLRQRGVIAKRSAWFLRSQGDVGSRDARRHIDWILDQLEPRGEALRALQAAGCETVVAVFWDSAKGQGGPALSPVNMAGLARLNKVCALMPS